jgi:hypothetical protein
VEVVMDRRIARALLVAAVVGVGLVSAFSVLGAVAAPMDNCDAVVGSITESADFTPYEVQRSKPFEVLLNPTRDEPVFREDTPLGKALAIGGLPARWEVGQGRTTARYYFESEVSALPLEEFFARGGILLESQPVVDGVVFADTLMEEVGDRAVAVQIGKFHGAMTWADPDQRGTRTHNVYWSDGTSNFGLITVGSPQYAVTLARSVACEG